MILREQVSLADYTTFGIGGPARWFAEAGDEDSVLEAVHFARERGAPLFVLGGGSNLLVSDAGYPGLVLHIALRGISKEGNVFRTGAGESWDGFVSKAIDGGFGGVECLAGIPGTVGGTPVQNVGAYGQEVSASIVSVRILDLNHLTFGELPNSACGFAYRRSIFNSTHKGRFIVTRVDYKLRPSAFPVLQYPDLKRYFQGRAGPPSLKEAAAAVREIRHDKGMLLVEGEPDCRSAGSFFRNPVIPQAGYDEIAAKASGPVPCYAASHGQVKIPAAWLVEQAGFKKGFVLGAAGLSSRHSLALINRGGATAAEISALRDLIVATVERRFGIALEPEPVFVGPAV
ncbi:MAG TPA: UDP-N-acetylmuramate dehydrogenase [Acidobacteriaceae bacterium]|jgi:UDP-N-acetylmuramate dehydrogenase